MNKVCNVSRVFVCEGFVSENAHCGVITLTVTCAIIYSLKVTSSKESETSHNVK